MARGFILGAATAAVFAVAVGTVASVFSPSPFKGPDPVVGNVGPASIVTPPLEKADVPVVPASVRARPPSPSVVLGQTPQVDTLEALGVTVMQPAATPNTWSDIDTVAPQVLVALPELPTEGAIAAATDTPVARNATSPALILPNVEAQVFVQFAPVKRARSPLTATVLDGDTADNSRPQTAEADAPLLPQVAQEQTPAPETTVAAVVEEEPQSIPTAPVVPASVIVPAAVSVAPQPNEVADVTPAQVQGTEDTQTQTPDVDAAEEPETPAPAAIPSPKIGKPAISLTGRSGGIVINRPGATADPDEASPTTAVAEEETGVSDSDARPIDRFRQTHDNPDAKPLMSIVLIDTGEAEIGEGTEVSELRDFPYPLSFAVDSALPDAQERMSMYRAEGFEVLSMIDLPFGALPSDAETTMSVVLGQMDQVVGVLEGPDLGFQETREVSDQITAILAQSGHGLVAQAKGLNTMPNLARKQGVPAAAVFRDFDKEGQNARVIRRFLDQAAFKARQEGAVIMLGRLRAETISALLLWGLQDRAGQVALAPVSAVLLRDAP